MNLADRLKNLRSENNLTQKQVAEKLSISYQQYQRWENSIKIPKIDNLTKLSRVFGVSISYLVCETDVRSLFELEEIFEELSESEQNQVIEYAREVLQKSTTSAKTEIDKF